MSVSDDAIIARSLQAFAKVRPERWVASVAIDWQHVVRIEAADELGMVQCVSCATPSPGHYGKYHGGHWIGRSRWSTIFAGDDGCTMNCHVQCPQCNRHDGDGTSKIRYTLWMLEHYGRDACDQLLLISEESRPQWTKLDLAKRRLGYIKRLRRREAEFKQAGVKVAMR